MLSCSYENTATVTIDTGIRKQAQLSLIDKVIAWFSLSKAVQADPVPGQLQQQINQITLTVYAPDMQTITENIPLDTGKITLEVPAGSQRTFEVVGYNSDNMREYGGIATVDLQPGQNVNLDIQMGKLLYLGEYWVSSSSIDYENDSIQIIFNGYPTVPIRGALGFKIYYSPDGTTNNATLLGGTSSWDILYENEGQSQTSSIRINTGVDLLDTWDLNQIGISIINKYGEGEIYFYY